MKTIKLPRILQPYYCNDLIRIGKDHDGGYLVNKEDISKSKNLLSFGINDDWSFEEQFLNINNCTLYGYDNSVNEEMLKNKNLLESHSNFFKDTKHHIPKNVGKYDTENEIAFKNLLHDKGTDIFLKCDIEGTEYDILDDIIINTKLFSGIVMEFHDVHDNEKFNELYNFISKIDQKLVHIHINNYAYFEIENGKTYVPSVIELTFTSSPNITLKRNINLPNPLDMPNCSDREDFQIVF
jgi:hypothetical protein